MFRHRCPIFPILYLFIMARASRECRLASSVVSVVALLQQAHRVGWHKRVDFVCGVSAHHVLDGLVTPGVVFHPGVHLEHMLIHDDDVLPLCYEALDLPCRHGRVYASRGSRLRVSHLGR